MVAFLSQTRERDMTRTKLTTTRTFLDARPCRSPSPETPTPSPLPPPDLKPSDRSFLYANDIVLYRPGLAPGVLPQECAVQVTADKIAVMYGWRIGRDIVFTAVNGTPGATPIKQDRADPESFPQLLGLVVFRVPLPERGERPAAA